MKKLIYNENTKEINVIEHGKSKAWLKNNKIFFEIISIVFGFLISIVSLVVSISGLKTANNTMKIYEKQLEIDKNNRKPLFELRTELINENIEENKKEYRYTLKYEGGQISHATALIRKYVEVEITYIEGKKIIEPIIFRAPISNKNYTNSVEYNESDKNFILHEIEYEENMRAFHLELSSRISLLIDGTRACVSGVKTYIEIVYNDYQNKQVKEKYEINNVYFTKGDKQYYTKSMSPEYDEDNIIYLNEVNKDNMESIAKQAKREFDQRWNLEGNEVIKN